MGKDNKEGYSPKTPSAGMSAVRESYNLAKLIRQGSRELERQYNSKKARREK
ncbi:MAG: hypothetical protein K2O14_14015 [Oscillospiraceae bacterium]|nr:hypothetical protein [Oscillospiraceae bacterium]